MKPKEEHTHMFVHVKDKIFLNSKRILTFSQKENIYDMSNVNMGPSVAYKYMKESSGGFENTGAIRINTINFIRDWIEFIRE
uniref:Uncharacterized protein n=1 Tax=Lactuca sativa TaxID=4236 RepID=A0A9R1UKC4_LACSA|nr:hypothetical protein LSAT_V11C900498280 [Lactuca sativa]